MKIEGRTLKPIGGNLRTHRGKQGTIRETVAPRKRRLLLHSTLRALFSPTARRRCTDVFVPAVSAYTICRYLTAEKSLLLKFQYTSLKQHHFISLRIEACAKHTSFSTMLSLHYPPLYLLFPLEQQHFLKLHVRATPHGMLLCTQPINSSNLIFQKQK